MGYNSVDDIIGLSSFV